VLSEIRALHEAGINVWFDEGMHAGSEWPEELANAISGCECLLYFVTPASVATRNCRDEIQFARECDKRIVVVHLKETVMPPALSLSLGSTHALKHYDLDEATYRKRLTSSIRGEADESGTSGWWTPRNRERSFWAMAIAFCLAIATGLLLNDAKEPGKVIRASVDIPGHLDLTPPRYLELQHGVPLALSPDGTYMVFSARNDSGTYRLYRRSMDSFEVHEITGTEEGTAPFFSPDGEWIGFVQGRVLRKISTRDNTTRTIVSLLPGEGFGGAAWGRDGTIVFTPSAVSGLYRVSAEGGVPKPLTTPGDSDDALTHLAPDILPGNRHVLFSSRSGMLPEPPSIELLDLETGERRKLIEGATGGRYAGGRILFGRSGAETGPVWALSFDADSLELGETPVQLVDEVASDLYSQPFFDVTASGVLAFIPSASDEVADRLLRRHTDGRVTEVHVSAQNIVGPAIAPDGTSILLTTLDDRRRQRVWQLDLRRGVLTAIPPADNQAHVPVWLPDGTGHVMTTNIDGPSNLYLIKHASGQGPDRLTVNDNHQDGASFSPDGRYLSYAEIDPETNWDLWLLDMETREPIPFLQTEAEEIQPIISPTGALIAYSSNESGRREVYLQHFPHGGNRQVVSVDGGEDPLWSSDGRYLYYRWQDQVFRVETGQTNPAELSAPELVFQGEFEGRAGYGKSNWDVFPGTEEFIYSSVYGFRVGARINVVANWQAELGNGS
jgi:Tol biopolymer transport system component